MNNELAKRGAGNSFWDLLRTIRRRREHLRATTGKQRVSRESILECIKGVLKEVYVYNTKFIYITKFVFSLSLLLLTFVF